MIRALFLALLLIGCQEQKSFLSEIKDDPTVILFKTPITSEAEAKRLLQNKVNYLKLLFEQSREPYYGTPKWSEVCLKENKIGELTVTEGEMKTISTLYLDQEGGPGQCPDNPLAKKYIVLTLHCQGQDFVSEIRIPASHTINLERNFCP